ncbi:alpha-ketoglutarate-dependent dioxygenase AlkB family protein [Streptomyces sp. NPDC055078]
MTGAALFPREPAVITPGAVHMPGWLPLERQRELVDACRSWARGPVPIRHTVLPGGGVMSVRTVCLGWHWRPYHYTRTADDVNGARVAALPDWLVELGRSALAEAYAEGRAPERDAGVPDGAADSGGAEGPDEAGSPDEAGQRYSPDTALINFYDGAARMGMHQDKEEQSTAPVVSLSIGDSCVFRFGNTRTRGRPYTDVELMSGDLFVFGGPARFAYHGVPKVLPGTADPATGLRGGRLNITLRETGLPG